MYCVELQSNCKLKILRFVLPSCVKFASKILTSYVMNYIDNVYSVRDDKCYSILLILLIFFFFFFFFFF